MNAQHLLLQQKSSLVHIMHYSSILRKAASEELQLLGEVPIAKSLGVSPLTYLVTVTVWHKLLNVNHGTIRSVGSTTDCQP